MANTPAVPPVVGLESPALEDEELLDVLEFPEAELLAALLEVSVLDVSEALEESAAELSVSEELSAALESSSMVRVSTCVWVAVSAVMVTVVESG